MEFENLIKISSMINAIYCNIQETEDKNEIINDKELTKEIDKWSDDLKSINIFFD